MIIFIKKFDGKTKDGGRTFHCYTLAECTATEDGKTKGYVKDFYTDTALDVDDLIFGDIVAVKFDDPESLGGRPVLSDIKKISDSPYTLI